VAITFKGDGPSAFGGPIVTTVVAAEQFHIATARREPTWFKTPEQESLMPLDHLFGGFINKSVNASTSTFSECMLMIAGQPPSSGAPFQFRALQAPPASSAAVLADASQKLLEAADILENQSKEITTSPKMAKILELRQQKNIGSSSSGSEGQAQAKEYIKGVSLQMRDTGQTLKGCTSKACDTKALISTIGDVLLATAFIVSAAGAPYVGIAIGIIAIIFTVTSIFLPTQKESLIPALNSYDIQRAVENALSKFSVAQTASEFEAFKNFAEIDVDRSLKFVSGLKAINATQGSRAQAIIIEELRKWHDEWSGSWTDYRKDLQNLESQFSLQLGTDPVGVRERLKAWISDCNTGSWDLSTNNKNLIYNGNVLLAACYEKSKTAKRDLNSLLQFSNAYLSAAFKIWYWQGTAVPAFSLASGCHEDILGFDCPWRRVVREITFKVNRATERAFYVQETLRSMSKDCTLKYPFDQSCDSQQCSFRYGLAISRTQYKNKLSQVRPPRSLLPT